MPALMPRRGVLAAVCTATAVSAVLTLAGCGPATSDAKEAGGSGASASKSPEPFDGLSGPAIANRALDATRHVSSLTLKADLKDPTEGAITLDIALSTKGDCTGTVGLDGGSAAVTKVGKTLYMKFDEKLLRAQSEGDSKADQDAAVQQMAGRWIKTPADAPDFKDFSSFCDLDTLLKEFSPKDTESEKKGPSTVDGVPAFAIAEKDGKDSYTVHVATEGKPYILRMVAKGSDAGTMTFSDFDKPIDVQAPASKDIVDLGSAG